MIDTYCLDNAGMEQSLKQREDGTKEYIYRPRKTEKKANTLQ